jgi:hypothetical protein
MRNALVRATKAAPTTVDSSVAPMTSAMAVHVALAASTDSDIDMMMPIRTPAAPKTEPMQRVVMFEFIMCVFLFWVVD